MQHIRLDSQALCHQRERCFLSQRDLASKSGVGVATIARLETGTQQASFKTIRRLAEALQVEPSELVKNFSSSVSRDRNQ